MYYIIQDKDLRGNSTKWANWMSKLAWNTCQTCAENHGKIISISELHAFPDVPVMEHINCQCLYVCMRTKIIGTATNNGFNGADAFLYYIQKLPDYYIDKKMAKMLGWERRKGNLSDILPGKMLGGDIYRNKEGKLPDAVGRIWHEADINYTGGYRNDERIIYSDDGLIFVTYDHYKTFYEIRK